MPRLQSSVAELVVEQGQPAGASAYLWLDPPDTVGAPGTRCLFLILEPTQPSAAATERAAEVHQRLREELRQARTQTATAALLSALGEVNRWLAQANALRPARRVEFGFTCVMTRGDEVYIAQAPPSQILISQEGKVYAFPGLDSWRWHRQEDDEGTTIPLGAGESFEPDLYHTRVEPGDSLVLCSSALARVIEREPQDVFASGDADEIIAHLGRLARAYVIDTAYAATIVIPPRRAARQATRGGDLEFLRRVTDWCSHLLPEETAERIRQRNRRETDDDEWLEPVDLEAPTVHTLEYPEGAARFESVVDSGDWVDSFANTSEFATITDVPGVRSEPLLLEQSDTDRDDEPYWEPSAGAAWEPGEPDVDARRGRGGKLSELLAGAVLALSAAVVGVWQLTINRDRPIDGPRDDGTLGLPRLNRYDHSVQMPDLTGVRRRLPRAPISRITAVVAVVLLLLVATGLVFSIRNSHQRQRNVRIEQTLQAAVVQREQAAQATDPVVAQAFLLAARESVRESEAIGLDPARAAQERAAINTDMDHALHIDRLANIQVIGGVPAAPAGVTPRVFFGNGQTYVFTDALYRLDANGTSLIRLIGSGDNVNGTPTGTLQGAAWGDGAPIVFDGSAAYVFDPTRATWTRQPIGTFGSAHTGIVSINGYSGNLYLLSPGTSQILKFAAGAFASAPEDWTSGVGAAELSKSVDMEIDGHIYVLLKDGELVDFYRSAIETKLQPGYVPAMTNAVSLSAQPDRPYFYLADDQGRIVRLSRDGKVVQQFMPADGGPSLAGTRDVAVDDVLSTAYILTDHALMTVRLPGPPR